jgi:hypothetical protein
MTSTNKHIIFFCNILNIYFINILRIFSLHFYIIFIKNTY